MTTQRRLGKRLIDPRRWEVSRERRLRLVKNTVLTT